MGDGVPLQSLFDYLEKGKGFSQLGEERFEAIKETEKTWKMNDKQSMLFESLIKERGVYNIQPVFNNTLNMNYNNKENMLILEREELKDIDLEKIRNPLPFVLNEEGVLIDQYLDHVLSTEMSGSPSIGVCTSPIRAFLGDIGKLFYYFFLVFFVLCCVVLCFDFKTFFLSLSGLNLDFF